MPAPLIRGPPTLAAPPGRRAGLGWVRLATPLGLVDVYNTHLHANYSHKTLSGDLELLPPASSVPPAGKEGKGRAAPPHAAPWVALPSRIKVPQDRFAPYRVAQICQLAEVRRMRASRRQQPEHIKLGSSRKCRHHRRPCARDLHHALLRDMCVHAGGAHRERRRGRAPGGRRAGGGHQHQARLSGDGAAPVRVILWPCRSTRTPLCRCAWQQPQRCQSGAILSCCEAAMLERQAAPCPWRCCVQTQVPAARAARQLDRRARRQQAERGGGLHLPRARVHVPQHAAGAPVSLAPSLSPRLLSLSLSVLSATLGAVSCFARACSPCTLPFTRPGVHAPDRGAGAGAH